MRQSPAEFNAAVDAAVEELAEFLRNAAPDAWREYIAQSRQGGPDPTPEEIAAVIGDLESQQDS